MSIPVSMIGAVVTTLIGSIALASDSVTTATVASAKVQGPGKLLSYPLIYRQTKHGRPQYFVVFRTRGPFAGRNGEGSTVPGTLMVEDAWDNHDGYGGAIGDGHPSGKCYTWKFPPPPQREMPRLDGKHTGARVRYSMELRGTTAQRGTATLRAYRNVAQLRRDMRAIGCRLAD